MSKLRNHSLLRICNQDATEFFGVGLCLNRNSAVTCAHVVADALVTKEGARYKNTNRNPNETVYVDFPLLAPKVPIPCIVKHWLWDVDDRAKDIAVLRFIEDPPQKFEAAMFAPPDTNLYGKTFSAFGVPEEFPQGTYADGEVRALNANQLVELNLARLEQNQEIRVRDGFSGGGIWIEEIGAYAGIAVTVWGRDNKLGEMLPVTALIEAGARLQVLQPDDNGGELARSSTEKPPGRGLDVESANLIYLIDREDEVIRVGRELLNSERRQANKRAAVLAVAGDANESHRTFIGRFNTYKEQAFIDLAKPRKPPVQYLECKWSVARGTGLVTSLCAAVLNLAPSDPSLEQATIENMAKRACTRFNTINQACAYYSLIDSASFDERDIQLMTDWLEFWRLVGMAGLKENVAVFLCFQFRDQAPEKKTIANLFRRPKKADMRDFVYSRFSSADQAGVACEEGCRIDLTSISISAIEVWLNGPVRRTRGFSDVETEQHIAKARKVFLDHAEVHMDDLILNKFIIDIVN